MTLIIPAGFAQITWLWEMNGDPEYMAVTCGVDHALGGGDFDPAASAAADAMLAAWPATGMSNQWRFRGVVARSSSGSPPYSTFESPRNVAGVGGANILPPNCALLVRKRTSVAGRRNRGRMYFPMLSVVETAVDQVGALAADSQVDLQTRLNTLYNALDSAGLSPVILHSDTPGQVTPVPAPTAIAEFVIQPRIATQRRRLRP